MAAIEQRDPAAGQYARALLDLADEQKLAAEIGAELASLAEVMQGTPVFGKFLRDPAVSVAEKRRMLETVLGARVNPLLLNTLLVMNLHGRLGLIVQMQHEYRRQLDAQLGNVEVDVTTAGELDDELAELVRQKVSAALKKNAIVRRKVDERIIGGLVLKVGDKMIDGSVKAQLESMKKKLLTAVR